MGKGAVKPRRPSRAQKAQCRATGGVATRVHHVPFVAPVTKLARTADAARLRKEHMLLELLSGSGIPVPRVEHIDMDAVAVGRPFMILANAGDLRVADYLQVHTPQSHALCRLVPCDDRQDPQ